MTDKKIGKLFEDEDLLYDPSGMEQALMSQLCKLKGLETWVSASRPIPIS